jgi:hypothetical protein
LDGSGLVERLPASPCTDASPPTFGEGGADPDPLDAGGGETPGGNTGPAESGGSSGTSIAPTVPSSSEFDPAVIAASVGTDAKATSSATISTYRRVGARKPSALYTPFRRLRMILRGGTSSSSSSGTAAHPFQNPTEPATAGRSTSGYPVSTTGERRIRRSAAGDLDRSCGRGDTKSAK